MTGFVLFGGILVVLIVAIVWAAVRAGDDTGVALAPHERRDAAIEALREVELEYRTGKLSEEEYRGVRGRLEREALAARDEAAGHAGPADPTAPCGECGVPLDGGEAFCPACGAPQPS